MSDGRVEPVGPPPPGDGLPLDAPSGFVRHAGELELDGELVTLPLEELPERADTGAGTIAAPTVDNSELEDGMDWVGKVPAGDLEEEELPEWMSWVGGPS